MNRTNTESIVKESLFQFIKKYLPSAEISSIDEIVLNYVVSILEDLGEENSGQVEDAFDAEGFCEMMAAYVPDFEMIRLPEVCLWMFELEATLRQVKESEQKHEERDLSELLRPLSLDESVPLKHTRKHQISETSDGSSYGSDSSGDYNYSVEENSYVATLMEAFPTVCEPEVLHCLAIARGDLAKAAQLIFDRQESGESLQSGGSVLPLQMSHQKLVVDDQELKNRIIQRYSFVDKDDDVREHRPVAPKSEPKKLVRYRDSKIVSMKGERYTEIKKEEDEEKRNAAGQKTARQNRFH